MGDLQENKVDMQQNYSVGTNDPKNMQELTQYVSTEYYIAFRQFFDMIVWLKIRRAPARKWQYAMQS